MLDLNRKKNTDTSWNKHIMDFQTIKMTFALLTHERISPADRAFRFILTIEPIEKGCNISNDTFTLFNFMRS